MSILVFLREVVTLSLLLGVLYGWTLVGHALGL
jgi:hypothetical protein